MDTEICPPGYGVIRFDRSSRGGGVAIFIDNTIQHTVISGPHNIESAFCRVYRGTHEILIGAVYRPPGATSDVIDALNDFLHHLRIQNKNAIIAGDFNVADVKWDEMMPGQREREAALGLLDLCFSHGLQQVVREYTRVQGNSKSVLDLLFLTQGLLSQPVEVEVLPGLSDHCLVSMKLSFASFRKKTIEVSSYRDFNRADDTAVLDELDYCFGPFEELSCNESVTVNELWLEFKSLVHRCITRYVPLVTKKKRACSPWITRNIIQLKEKSAGVGKSTDAHSIRLR